MNDKIEMWLPNVKKGEESKTKTGGIGSPIKSGMSVKKAPEYIPTDKKELPKRNLSTNPHSKNLSSSRTDSTRANNVYSSESSTSMK